MADEIIIGDPMFESSITHPVFGDYHSRRGDKLLAQAEGIVTRLDDKSLSERDRTIMQGILTGVLEKLAKCGPYYIEKANKLGYQEEILITVRRAVAATPKGQEFLGDRRIRH